MWYNVLISAVFGIGIAIVAPCFFIWGFRTGKSEKSTESTVKKPFLLPKSHKESEEMERNRAILANIENYSGDGSNQRRI